MAAPLAYTPFFTESQECGVLFIITILLIKLIGADGFLENVMTCGTMIYLQEACVQILSCVRV